MLIYNPRNYHPLWSGKTITYSAFVAQEIMSYLLLLLQIATQNNHGLWNIFGEAFKINVVAMNRYR